MTRRRRANAVAWRSQLVPRPGEAVEEQQRRCRRPGSGPPSEGRRRRCRSSPRQGRGHGGGRLAMELDVARPVGPEREHPDARPADRRRPARRGSMPAIDLAVLAAERGHDRPDVDAVGRPEELLVVLGQADLGRIGRRPAAGTRRSRRRRCRPGRSSPTGRAAGPTRGRSGRAGTTRRRRRGRPARRRPPPPRARSTRRRRCRSRRGSTAAGSLARCPRSQSSRSRTGMLLPAHSSAPSGRDVAEDGERQSLERLVAGLHGREPRRQRRVGGPIGVEPGASPTRPARGPSGAGSVERIGQRAGRGHVRRRGRTSSAGWPDRSSRGRRRRRSGSARASVSMVSIGLDVGVAPNRIDEVGQVRVAPRPGADEVVARG